MSLRDAVNILAFRRHLSDVDRALQFVGYQLRAPLATPQQLDAEEQSEVESMREILRKARDRRLHEEEAGPSDGKSAVAVRRRSMVSDEQGWRWGAGVVSLSAATVRPRDLDVTPDGFVASVTSSSFAAPPAAIPPTSDRDSRWSFGARSRRSDVSLPVATLSGVVQMTLPGRRIDVEQTVRKLARLEPMATLPRLTRRRPARRVAVVMDIGQMEGPFGEDVQAIFQQVASTLPDSEVVRIAFRDLLSRGCGPGPVWSWTAYRFPSRTTASVFVTGSFGGDPTLRRRELDITMSGLNRRVNQTAHGVWIGAIPPTLSARTSLWTVID